MTNQLSNHERLILTTIRAYTATIAEWSPQLWWGPHEREEYEADVEYGPLWSPSRWFKFVDTNAEVVRLTRLLRKLETAGLVLTFRLHGKKSQHVRLTRDGERLAKRLTAETNGKD